MMKVGIFSWFSYSLPIEDRLRMIKDAGFDATSLWWGDENRHLQPEIARKLGLEIDNIHTPFTHPNDLWLDRLDGEEYLNMLLQCVEDCAQHTIPIAVIHVTGFSQIAEISQIGMDRVKRLVEAAEKKGIGLAFENLAYLQHLDWIFDTIKSDHLGFCYDSGHENCFCPDTDCLGKFGDRLFAVHLDDNFGDSDTHLLPFDGTVDWAKVKEKLSTCRAVPYLTMEVDFNPKHEKSQIYQGLSAQEYLALAYQRILKLV
jgi:L-ribulose-5-phosphate 3-epimerase